MRPLIFLFPHNRMDVGGNSAQVRIMEACRRYRQITVAYYGSRIAGQAWMDDLLAMYPERPSGTADAPIFVIHWGPDIPMLLEALGRRDVIYVAHSTGWGLAIPPTVPILSVSQHTMAYWGRYAPNCYIAHVPNVVETQIGFEPVVRDIDVLVQVRKSSRYLLDRLVPALALQCRVTLLDGWVEDLSGWFRRSKVYLYDSLEHWIKVGATEGFGLPPLEAMSQGCVVFSSINDALADYLDPGFNCRKIRVHSLAWDLAAILQAVEDGTPSPPQSEWFQDYTMARATARLRVVLEDVERFFAFTRQNSADIEDLWAVYSPGVLQRVSRAVRILKGRRV
ncbi:glycosyltransferase family 4 protein [Novosphingobium resinovorum]|uniref:glycosyltransferase n=1 Tax=Novosphingobium resinovorum TaxID=158500 RepID=UPI002ED61924|nr:glycosyltransferase family 4 protein [Novosphingobium resinovorum]